jgi:hypothetical protein
VGIERRPPLDPPLQFTSAPVFFPDDPSPASLLAAIGLLALCFASASHLGLVYAVWRRAPA